MEIVDTDTLSRREFEGLALAEPFLSLLGFIEWAFSMLVWGRAGSGKSTFAMGLAKALLPFAKARGKRVLYVSSEEGPHMTSSMRAARLGALDADLLISDFDTIQSLREAILKHGVQFLIVDSVTVVDPTTDEAKRFLQWLRKEGIGVALIAHALKSGDSYKGNSRLGHDIYTEVRCYTQERPDGEEVHVAETVKNRYAPLAEIEIPMTAREISRTNPDCSTSPQSQQCKAMFARLQEDGEYVVERAEGESSKKKSSKKKKKKARKKSSGKGSASSEAKAFDEGLNRIEKMLSGL